MNYNLVFRNVETIDGKRKEIIDNTKTLKDWSHKLQNLTVKGGDINSAQLNQLINDSERKNRTIQELLNKVEKMTNDNKKLLNNQLKLKKRIEKLEKDDSNATDSIPEF